MATKKFGQSKPEECSVARLMIERGAIRLQSLNRPRPAVLDPAARGRGEVRIRERHRHDAKIGEPLQRDRAPTVEWKLMMKVEILQQFAAATMRQYRDTALEPR